MPAAPLAAPFPPLPPPDGAVPPFRCVVVALVKFPAAPVPADEPPPPPKLPVPVVPAAPVPPLNFVVPIPALARPPAPLVLELSATLPPPFANNVAVDPNQESPPAAVVELPAPTVTVYTV